MSIYSGSVSTRLLEPVNFSNNRCEFRLNNDSAYLSNMRLINVSANSDGSQSAMIGWATIIKSIQLYSGNQLLDQVTDFSKWMAWKNINNSNQVNSSLNRINVGTALGFESQGANEFDATGVRDIAGISLSLENEALGNGYDEPTLPDASAWLNLRDVFGFLGSSDSLPTNILQNLRLVIQFINVSELNKIGSLNNATLLEPTRPLLVVDEVNDSPQKDAIKKAYSGVRYESVEVDKVFDKVNVAPTADQQLVQENTYLLNGFNNKFVSKVLIIQEPLSPDTYEDPDESNSNNPGSSVTSMPQWNTKYQVRINGNNKFMGNSIDLDNARLALLTDMWGDTNIFAGGNLVNVKDSDILYNTDIIKPGLADYTTCPIEEYVNELKVTFGRTALGSNPDTSQDLFINVFGMVRKSLQVNKDGSFNITY